MGGHDHHHKAPVPENIARIIANAAAAKPRDYPAWPSSETGGVIPMAIESRFVNERERLGPDFNDKWRKWRAQFIKDQELHPCEPIEVPQLRLELVNPIRRMYQIPGDYVQKNLLAPVLGANNAAYLRYSITRGFLLYCCGLIAWYNIKHRGHNWETRKGARVWFTKEPVYPGDPAYPLKDPRPHKWQHYDSHFSERKVFTD